MAIGTTAMLYVLVIDPHNPELCPVIFPGLFANDFTNNCLGVSEGLCPQALEAATTIFPPWKVAPKFTDTDVVPWPLAMLAPEGTVQT